MSRFDPHRRNFLRTAGALTGTTLLSRFDLLGQSATGENRTDSQSENPADYTLTIATKPIELAPNRIISVACYTAFASQRQ
jgi:hypothetical protein